MRNVLNVAIALALAGMVAMPGRAATFNVANGDVAGLKNAINAANANNVADVINLAAGGNYTLSAVDNNSVGPTGLPIVINDLAGPDLTINGNNATIQRGALAPAFRILLIDTGANVSLNSLNVHNGRLVTTIDDVTSAGGNILSSGVLALTNCSVTGGNSAFAGGGILSVEGTLNLNNCRINNNTARAGGGILAHVGTFTMNGCTLNGNRSTTEGGAVFTEGEDSILTSTISNSVFSNNIADGGGGAVFNVGGASESGGNPSGSSTLTLNSCTFSGNSARDAGGVYNFNGSVNSTATMNLNNCTIQGNSAQIGGGIGNASLGGTATMNLAGCTLNNNSSSEGGAGENFAEAPSGGSARLNLFNCTVSNNNANGTAPDTTRSGGAFLNLVNGGTAALSLTSCTLFNNSAPGGGLHNTSESGAGTLTLANCILKAGSGSNINNFGTITSLGYNLSSDSANGFLNQTGDQINKNANLGALANNGGPTQTHALLAGSPAIDKGRKFNLVADQRGVARPSDNPSIANAANGDGSDIGAFEVQAQQSDTTPPSIAIANPGANAFVKALPSISGTASDNATGVVRVDLYLQRKSDNLWWNGTQWASPISVLATTLSGAAPRQWVRNTGLPAGAALTNGLYFIAARAFDGANNGTTVTRNFTVDTVLPTVSITSPAPGSTVNSFDSASGKTSDIGGSGVIRVNFFLQRKSDNLWWNGSAWVASAVALPTSLAPISGGQSWSISSLLPKDANLRDGSYQIGVVSIDRADNRGTAIGTFTLNRLIVNSGAASPSSVVLSSASANSDGTIKLTFSGALGASANDAANYSVASNGQAVDITNVSQTSASTVDIQAGALLSGARVSVAYDIQDAQGRAIAGKATVVVK